MGTEAHRKGTYNAGDPAGDVPTALGVRPRQLVTNPHRKGRGWMLCLGRLLAPSSQGLPLPAPKPEGTWPPRIVVSRAVVTPRML